MSFPVQDIFNRSRRLRGVGRRRQTRLDGQSLHGLPKASRRPCLSGATANAQLPDSGYERTRWYDVDWPTEGPAKQLRLVKTDSRRLDVNPNGYAVRWCELNGGKGKRPHYGSAHMPLVIPVLGRRDGKTDCRRCCSAGWKGQGGGESSRTRDGQGTDLITRIPRRECQEMPLAGPRLSDHN